MGIIGSNGAGKSTLMRAMAGILPPTSGSIEVWGRASTLLALGVGFNQNLSGRENIILGGLAPGLSRREIEERAERGRRVDRAWRLHRHADADVLLGHVGAGGVLGGGPHEA